MARKQIVILGGGTGGTMTANRLRRRFDPDEAEIHVVDRDDRHVYQPGLLFVPFGLAQLEEIEQKKALGVETGGFAPPDRMAVSKAGPFFVRLVLDSYHQEKITANDLSSFLEVRLKHIPKIEHAVLHRPMSSGAQA